MESKNCSICFQTKPIKEFKYRICKKCISFSGKEKRKAYYQDNKTQLLMAHKKRRESKAKQIAETNIKWREKNPEKVREIQKRYRKKNKEKIKEEKGKWQKNNPNYMQKYKKKRRIHDPVYTMQERIRTLIREGFRQKKWGKRSKTLEIIGCDFDQAIEHLKLTAIKNYGSFESFDQYEIDHIIPFSLAKTEDHMKQLSHISNLQFLKKADNRKKGSKLNWEIT